MGKSSETRNQWLNDFSLGLREEFNLTESDALNSANRLMDRISRLRPAGNYYWPGADKQKRDQEILNSLSKMSIADVCKKHRVSQKRVYSIRSNAMRKRHEQQLHMDNLLSLPNTAKKQR